MCGSAARRDKVFFSTFSLLSGLNIHTRPNIADVIKLSKKALTH